MTGVQTCALPISRSVPVELRPLFDDALLGFASESAAGQLAMENETPPGLTVNSDPVLLTRAIEALLSNAVRFSIPGGTIQLYAHSDGETVRLHIRDQGIGMERKIGRGILRMICGRHHR